MKKILLATSALVASASIAAADVSITGFAEMGLADPGTGDVGYHQDIDVTFSMSGETDNGMTFGAAIDLDEVNNAGVFDANDDGGSSLFISSAWGTLSMGDTDTAADWATQETDLVGSFQDEMENFGRDGNSDKGGDEQVLRYDYSFSNFGIALSYVQFDDGATTDNDRISVGGKFSTEFGGAGMTFGVGYVDIAESNDDAISASATLNVDALTAVVFYSDDESDINGENIGVAVSYSMGALTLGANYGEWDASDESAFGLAANYDLGGGAVLQAGYTDNLSGGDDEAWSVGLAMNF